MTNSHALSVSESIVRSLVTLCLVFLVSTTTRADQQNTANLDQNTVYRLDLFTESLKPTLKKELKKGAVYFRYSSIFGHHVWSRFSEEKGFEFAMGPGSVQPAWKFDIREGRNDQLRLLENRSPELYKRLTVQGARPMIKLLENGHWELDVASNEGRVFDLESGERWEWHGGRQIRVVHAGGIHWKYRGQNYQPAYNVLVAW
jgi:hypothetical protein